MTRRVARWGVLGLILGTAAAAAAPARAAEGSPGRMKILGLSLLLPGLGHRALGEPGRGYAYLGAEASIWGAFGVFQAQGKIRKNSYVEIAEVFAGVREASGRSSDYYRLLGQYRSSDEYDDEVRRDARARHGDDLNAREAYYERYRVPDDEVWSWSSLAAWERYRDKRNDSNRAYKRAGYMVGVAVANRLLAAVDAIRISHKRSSGSRMGFYLSADPFDPGEPTRFCVSLPLP